MLPDHKTNASAGLAHSVPYDHRSLIGFARRPRSNAHLKLVIGNKTFGYTYIRKNGCSSFKELLGYSRHTNIVEILRTHALARDEAVDHLIFVYRDPIERMKSLFQNKFIDKDGHEDITRAFNQSMPGAELTFSNFLTFAQRGIDPHCWTQTSHLLARKYTNAIELKDLFPAMEELVGEEAAAAFRHKANRSKPKSFDVSEEAIARIRHIYRADYAMIDKIKRRKSAG